MLFVASILVNKTIEILKLNSLKGVEIRILSSHFLWLADVYAYTENETIRVSIILSVFQCKCRCVSAL